ncbi:MAG: hypothetical protein K0S82_253 [Gaiellaceae bacterium]|jgi:hypothetical protein|nr:hypothetical protein [Gaiellaceae bacterium]
MVTIASPDRLQVAHGRLREAQQLGDRWGVCERHDG